MMEAVAFLAAAAAILATGALALGILRPAVAFPGGATCAAWICGATACHTAYGAALASGLPGLAWWLAVLATGTALWRVPAVRQRLAREWRMWFGGGARPAKATAAVKSPGPNDKAEPPRAMPGPRALWYLATGLFAAAAVGFVLPTGFLPGLPRITVHLRAIFLLHGTGFSDTFQDGFVQWMLGGARPQLAPVLTAWVYTLAGAPAEAAAKAVAAAPLLLAVWSVGAALRQSHGHGAGALGLAAAVTCPAALMSLGRGDGDAMALACGWLAFGALYFGGAREGPKPSWPAAAAVLIAGAAWAAVRVDGLAGLAAALICAWGARAARPAGWLGLATLAVLIAGALLLPLVLAPGLGPVTWLAAAQANLFEIFTEPIYGGAHQLLPPVLEANARPEYWLDYPSVIRDVQRAWGVLWPLWGVVSVVYGRELLGEGRWRALVVVAAPVVAAIFAGLAAPPTAAFAKTIVMSPQRILLPLVLPAIFLCAGGIARALEPVRPANP